MARKKAPKGPTPVEAITHTDTRTNIPTADAIDLVSPDVEETVQVAYPREIRSPMLVWNGKEALDETDLQADAPPLYIQEKVDPRVLIENLRKTAKEGEPEPELTLFETFDGLNELDLVEFYKHSANWSNRMILGDSLQVMASLAERERLRGQVQMIYIDPPYGIKFGSNWQVSTRSRSVQDGKAADSAREAEQVRAFRDTWELGVHSYLSYLRDRLQVARDLLTPSGSVFVQIGDQNVHLVRTLLDEVFGPENFVNEIAFQKTTGAGSPSGSTELLSQVFDYVLWYARDKSRAKYRELLKPKGIDSFIPSAYRYIEKADGTRGTAKAAERKGTLEEGDHLYALDNLTSQSGVDKTRYEVKFGQRTFRPGSGVWKTSQEGMQRLLAARRVDSTAQRLGYVRYLEDFPAMRFTNMWTDTVSSFMKDKIYVVQTNTKVVDRCILMTTDPGDLVLDPTCGSGTTAYVAERWGRRWITIDSSRVALALARQRLMAALFPYYVLADSDVGRGAEEKLSGTALPDQPTTDDIRMGFVYQRIRHITLKSIANNPDVHEGMSRTEITEAIDRHADVRPLFDQPVEDPTRVRVSGPFTVESLSPHRSRADSGNTQSDLTRATREAGKFVEMILENLREAGIQNGRRPERLEFDVVDPYPGLHVQAIGIREAPEPNGVARAAICVGPQYGTVGPSFVKDAAREVTRSVDIDLLCILAFAFEPQVLHSDEDFVASDESFDVAGTRSLGRVPVLLVRMNSDLLMGAELAAKAGGNLFTTFGQPDVDIAVDGDEVSVELRGVDVYDPNTGEVRSDKADRVALWMIDTDYDGESFFVRHCYFTGGQDPYHRLRKALSADIDEEAWATLYRTMSRPFPKPSTGRIALKVINDYGDEVVNVYDVPSATSTE